MPGADSSTPNTPAALAGLSEEMQAALAALAPIAAAHGLPLGDPSAAPEIPLHLDLRRLAIHLGDICRTRHIYRAENEIVTVDDATGRALVMDPDTFRSWILEFCVLYKKRDTKTNHAIPADLALEQARGILKSHQFRQRLRPLNGINSVRQPVRRADHTIALLPLGYDPESGIYTTAGCDYPADLDPNAAVLYLRSLFAAFPWSDDRSLAVHLAALFTVYGQLLLPPGTITPLFAYNANEPGSGKTLLVKLILTTIFGRAGATSIGDNEEELRKRLDAAAQHLQPFLFFDDEIGFIKNQLLNGWITARYWEGRILGTSKWFYMPKRAITFICGNGITLSEDLGRRTLLVDLFSVERVRDRILPPGTETITDEWLESPTNRKKTLSALWALTKYSLIDKAAPPKKLAPALKSFESWSSIIPRIVVDSTFADPQTLPDIPDAGNKSIRDLEKLVEATIDTHLFHREYDPDTGSLITVRPLISAKVELSQMVPLARRLNLFLEILDTTDMILMDLERGGKSRGWREDTYIDQLGQKEKRLPLTDEEKRAQAEAWYDRPMANTLRSRFKGHLGQLFRGPDGANYRLGDRTGSRVSTFIISRV